MRKIAESNQEARSHVSNSIFEQYENKVPCNTDEPRIITFVFAHLIGVLSHARDTQIHVYLVKRSIRAMILSSHVIQLAGLARLGVRI